jgi:hypothetical protein
MSRILVVYYSRTGTVREVARRLATQLGADIDEISDPTPRAGVLGFIRSAFEARRRRIAPIAPSDRNPADYDLVVIGTPVWGASMSSPVRAYLQRHHGAIRAAAFFCTCGSTGSPRVFAQLEDLSGLEPAARMVLRQDDVGTVTANLTIDRFADEITAAARPHAPPDEERPPAGGLH